MQLINPILAVFIMRRYNGDGQRTSLSYLQKPKNNFATSLEKLTSANNEVFEYIKNTFETEMDNGIFKQSNADQVKGNATKLEYTNYSKNL